MTQHIGRNDPCPCGSGKKYKHCHLGKAPEESPTAAFPFPTVNESFVLGALLQVSPPFRRAYNAERVKITTPLGWTNKLAMPPEVVAQAIHLPLSTATVMYLRRIPAVGAHALEIAHELLHVVLSAEGFPLLTTKPEHAPVAALLNNLVQDPLISQRLEQYHFPIEQKLERDLAFARASMQGVAAPVERQLQQLWVLSYAGQLLECAVHPSSALESKRAELERWFVLQHPVLAAEAEQVLQKVNSIGYDTPERMREVFAWAAQHYNVPSA